MFNIAVKSSGDTPIIAGTGSNSTAESILLTQEAENIGVDGVMLVCPYYNKPTQKGLYQHFKAIANSTKLPIILYNIPKRTGVNLEWETTIKLAETKNIIAIKEASGDLGQISNIIRYKPPGFILYSGDDLTLLPVLSLGGSGVVSVCSHLVGREISELINSFFSGKL